MSILLSIEQLELIKINLYSDKPITSRELAKMFNCSKTTILRARQKIIDEVGFQSKPLFSKEDQQLICESLLSGKSYSDMARKFHVSIPTIIRYANKWSVSKLKNFNHNYFEDIDCDNKAYWLGFIAADGCINSNVPSLSINISQKDLALLEKFASDIEFNNQIFKNSTIIKETGNFRHMCTITCTSKKLIQDLSKYGLGPQKSLTLKAPQNIPDDLIRHWIRGYIDGDGCFTWNKKGNRLGIKVLGTESVLEYIKKYLQLTCNVTNYGKIKNLSTGGNIILTRVGHYLYDDASVFLKRKRSKFDKLLGTTELGY